MNPSQNNNLPPAFDIDYKRLVLLLLPTFLRKSRLFAFLTAMTVGIDNLYSAFKSNRNANITRIRSNGQVCYLQGTLNNELDPTTRLITIKDGEPEGNWLMAYDQGYHNQLLIRKEPGGETGVHLVYSEEKISNNASTFYVSVPWANTKEKESNTNHLRALLNEYKLLSKKYNIIFKS